MRCRYGQYFTRRKLWLIDSTSFPCYGFRMGKKKMKQEIEIRKKWLNVNVALIAVNTVVWLVMNAQGDTRDAAFMYEHGALFPPDVLAGEWYRLFCSIFLHFGAEHLISNMFMQYFLGDMLLRALSQWKFALIYLLAGLEGSMTSLAVMEITGDYAVSAGASGAIYGIIGALLWVVLRNGGKFESISIKRMLLAMVVYISYGFTTEAVDGWAHLGGAMSGFLLAVLLYRRKVTCFTAEWQ